MSDAREVIYRHAERTDHDVVVGMLGELVDEVGPRETALRVKRKLPEDVMAALSSSDVLIIVAQVGSEPVGLARADILSSDPIFRLRDDHRCGYVDQMFVRPAFRGRSIGAEMLRRCEAWFRSRGIAHSILHAAPRAVRFYAQHGYQPNREMFKRL